MFYLMNTIMVGMMSVGLVSCNSDEDFVEDYGVRHYYVDLGLPSGTLWATMNVGASKPEDYGDYFAWGETVGYNGGKTKFTWNNYKYCYGYDGIDCNTFWKYCTKSTYGTKDYKTELEAMDDAATANWGIEWQMPSETQCAELLNSTYTTTEWTTMNGVYGMKITSKSNGKNIFLPAGGYREYDEHKEGGGGLRGCFWSRSLNTKHNYEGYDLEFSSNFLGTYYDGRYRRCGYSVRPVRVQK